MRYNKAFIRARFEFAMKDLGLNTRVYDDDAGEIVSHYDIDHASCYGGYKIVYYTAQDRIESEPFGRERYNAREFVAHLNGIIGVARVQEAAAHSMIKNVTWTPAKGATL